MLKIVVFFGIATIILLTIWSMVKLMTFTAYLSELVDKYQYGILETREILMQGRPDAAKKMLEETLDQGLECSKKYFDKKKKKA